MRAGKLRDVLFIQRSSTTVNEAGTPQQVWEDVATLYAEQVTCTADDLTQRFGNATQDARVFRTRWFADITLADRITYDGTPFTIKKLVPDPRRRSLEISIHRVGL
jgi:SPP1 family predicted phage head-tail adaptor